MIRVFPRKTKWTPTDELAFVGEPPLPPFRPSDPDMPVMVSCAFTWDVKLALRLADSWRRFYRRVEVGGPGFADPGGEFIAGRFLKNGVTITSRGCPNACPWCFVWRRSGTVRTLPIVPGRIIQDDNLLSCPRKHIEAVFDMLTGQRQVVFSGGLDARLLQDWHRDLLEKVNVDEIWTACDSRQAESDLIRAAKIFDGISIEKLRCYVLIGSPGEWLGEAESRLEWVYSNGFLPFAQLYRGDRIVKQAVHLDPQWRALARKWSRPAAYRRKDK
jgi:hypothetical protein